MEPETDTAVHFEDCREMYSIWCSSTPCMNMVLEYPNMISVVTHALVLGAQQHGSLVGGRMHVE